MESIYKWNKDGTGVSKLIDGKPTVTIPLGHSLWAEEVEGNEIEPYKTDAELEADAKIEREIKRDEIEKNAILLYDDKLFFMTPRARKNMSESRGPLGRGGTLNWPCYDPNTDKKSRYLITQVEFEKFEDALFKAINSLHVQTDTQEPINPWPLEVE